MKKQRFAGQKNKNRNTYVSFTVKAQSAMEYLMTYGWAILIIAIVMVALFSLGVFNSANFTPRAQPGSCQVYRPNGPGTTSFINLGGVCNGELPQYVASFGGGSEYVAISPLIWTRPSYTLSAWVNINSISGQTQNQSIIFENGLNSGGCIKNIEVYKGSFLAGSYPISPIEGSSVTTDTWYFLTLTYDAETTTEQFYINGSSQGRSSGTVTFPTNGGSYGSSYQVLLGGMSAGNNGCFPDGGYWQSMEGELSNVQFYNTSLSSNDIQALYREGIGGAPIDLQNLVGWWPLNGNANDYSGNGNNGVPTGVTYTSSWTSSYTPP